MNCPEYDPDAYGCMSPLVHGRCPNTSTRQCENGWLSFWTPAERAGLKAMGNVIKTDRMLAKISGYTNWANFYAKRWMVKVFVAAARRSRSR